MYTRNNFEYYFDLTRMINVHLEYFHIHLRHDVNSFDLRPARSSWLRSFRGVRSKKIRSFANDRIVGFSKICSYQGFLYENKMFNLIKLGCPLSVFCRTKATISGTYSKTRVKQSGSSILKARFLSIAS